MNRFGLYLFVDLSLDDVWIEPSMPSIGGSVEGLERCEVGQGGFKIKSYKVLDWE